MSFVPFKKTRMFGAVEGGEIKTVTELLDKGVNPDLTDEIGRTLLLCAIASGQDAIAALLIERGADLGKRWHSGMTYLHKAAEYGRTEIAELLLKKTPALLHVAASFHGYTALHTAASHGHAEFAAFLILKGINPDVKNHEGRTALFLAQKENHKEVEEILSKVTKIVTLSEVPQKERPAEWKKLSSQEIAHISVRKDIGYKITDIFNFRARELQRKTQNLETKVETAETIFFDAMPDNALLQEAFDALKEQRGNPDPASIPGQFQSTPLKKMS